MTAIRVVLLLAGLGLGLYGAVLLYDNPPVILLRIAIWAGAGVLLHDFVFAPVSAALGWAGRRVIPSSVRVPVGVAGLCVVVLALLAVPVFDKPGAHRDNFTVLDRDYHQGLLLAVGAVAVALLCYLLASRLLPIRQDQVVDRQRADDVDRQPPAV
jgi:NADH:ubiquinone oxidoreductase subunit 6 (subunit J)